MKTTFRFMRKEARTSSTSLLMDATVRIHRNNRLFLKFHHVRNPMYNLYTTLSCTSPSATACSFVRENQRLNGWPEPLILAHHGASHATISTDTQCFNAHDPPQRTRTIYTGPGLTALHEPRAPSVPGPAADARRAGLACPNCI
jgi:hypothetical protein